MNFTEPVWKTFDVR